MSVQRRLVVLLGILAMAQSGPLCAAAKSAEQVFAEVSRSTVTVLSLDAAGAIKKLGSGVVIAPGEVITNCHVVDAGRFQVRHEGMQLDAELRYADRERDLCQLHVENLQAPGVARTPSGRVAVGAQVFAVGAPEGLELSISDGLVSGIRDIKGLSGVIQTTAPISPGSSGGGLYDRSGALIGITTFYLATGQNLNFALPAAWIDELPTRAPHQTDLANEVARRELAALGQNWRANDPDYARKEPLVAAALQQAMDSGTPAEAWVSITKQAYDEAEFAYRVRPFFDASDWPNVIRVATEWTIAYPKSPAAWFMLGEAHTRFAQRLTEHALAIGRRNYGDSNVDLQIATMDEYDAQREGELSRALDAYRMAAQLAPNNAQVLFALGLAYDGRGDTVGVVTVMQQLEGVDPRVAALLRKTLTGKE